MEELINKFLSKNQIKTLSSRKFKLDNDISNSKNNKKRKCC